MASIDAFVFYFSNSFQYFSIKSRYSFNVILVISLLWTPNFLNEIVLLEQIFPLFQSSISKYQVVDSGFLKSTSSSKPKIRKWHLPSAFNFLYNCSKAIIWPTGSLIQSFEKVLFSITINPPLCSTTQSMSVPPVVFIPTCANPPSFDLSSANFSLSKIVCFGL